MASSTDFKLLFEKYQEDGVKQGISIVKYCQMNGIVYSHFERWYIKNRAGVVLPVEIVDESGLLDKSEGGSSSILSECFFLCGECYLCEDRVFEWTRGE